MKPNSYAALFIVLIALVLVPVAADAALILNGSFESGKNTDGSDPPNNFMLINANSTIDIDNWTTGPDVNAWYWRDDPGNAQNGSRWINFAAFTAPQYTISQSFAVSRYLQYTVSYYERERVNAGNTLNASISLSAGTATGTLSQTANNQTTTWTQFSFVFVPNSDGIATLTFAGGGTTYNHGDPPYYGTGLDNVAVTELVIPEPMSLSGLVVAAMIGIRRRQRRMPL